MHRMAVKKSLEDEPSTVLHTVVGSDANWLAAIALLSGKYSCVGRMAGGLARGDQVRMEALADQPVSMMRTMTALTRW